jgi:hypothetical protein
LVCQYLFQFFFSCGNSAFAVLQILLLDRVLFFFFVKDVNLAIKIEFAFREFLFGLLVLGLFVLQFSFESDFGFLPLILRLEQSFFLLYFRLFGGVAKNPLRLFLRPFDLAERRLSGDQVSEQRRNTCATHQHSK